MRVIRWQADRKACRAAWASDKQAYTRDCISNHFIQSILQQHRCTFSLGGYRTAPRLLQNHWLTDRPWYGQTDTRTERLGICAASRAFVFSRWISLTENQWRCTLTETQSNQKGKDDGGLTRKSRARTFSNTADAGLRLRTFWWRFRRVHVRECVSHDRGTHLIIFANYTTSRSRWDQWSPRLIWALPKGFDMRPSWCSHLAQIDSKIIHMHKPDQTEWKQRWWCLVVVVVLRLEDCVKKIIKEMKIK